MSERRIAKSVHTREIIPVALAGDPACYLLAMTGDQLEILMNLLNYAHRRINWCDEVIDSARYYLPDDAKWDELSALVADLEFRLMDVCSLEDLIAALECVCTATTALNQNQQQSNFGGTLPSSITDFLPYASVPVPADPQVDETACALAQLTWQSMYETMTEVILPYTKVGFEGALAAVTAACAAATGGVSLIVAEIIIATGFLALIEGAYSEAEANITNWLLSAKDEIVCAAYYGWRDIGQQGAADAVEVFIEEATELSFGDKTAAKIALAIALPVARIALSANSQWAQDNVEPGVCDECPPPVGCFNFCDEGWTIVPEYATLDEETCAITMQGEMSGYIGAFRSIEFDAVHVEVYIDPPAYELPFFAVQIRVENGDLETETWVIEVNSTGPLLYVHDFALAHPHSVEILNVAGTHTIVYYLCASEVTA